jgi:methylated-DNA-[protein]-cysteine S-methyltransferase
MNELFCSIYDSPIGSIKISAAETSLLSINFIDNFKGLTDTKSSELTELCKLQLNEYFRGERRIFDLQFLPSGTDFQQKVWSLVSEIRYGKTESYLSIAKKMGDPKKIRAVGAANRKNPLLIIIPCHRIIGETGKLIGYSGGVWRKQWLLEHEDKFLNGQTLLFPGFSK